MWKVLINNVRSFFIRKPYEPKMIGCEYVVGMFIHGNNPTVVRFAYTTFENNSRIRLPEHIKLRCDYIYNVKTEQFEKDRSSGRYPKPKVSHFELLSHTEARDILQAAVLADAERRNTKVVLE